MRFAGVAAKPGAEEAASARRNEVVGDFHLAAVVGWALIGKPVDDDGMLELLEPWRGHRHRVMRLIESSGFVKPRFGPRAARVSHRHH